MPAVNCSPASTPRRRGRQKGESYKRGPRKAPQPTSILVPAKPGANEYGIPYTTLRKLVHQGALAVVKFGDAWFFRRADLDLLIERHTERGAVQS
jgi:excisionase family DNA binding protein